jgi:WD40 repeat protein
MKFSVTILSLLVGLILSISAHAQDVYLSAYKKFSSGSGEVDNISFSDDSKIIGVTDKKGNLYLVETESSNVLKKIPASGKIIFQEFLDKDKKFIAVRSNGQFSTYSLTSFEETKGSQTFPSPLYVSLDPNQVYLTVLEKNNQIEIFDLKAGMTQTRIQSVGDLKNPLFLGFDRFGQQLAAINNVGESFSWEFINSKFLRELKLQSGEYGGSRSVIHAASASKGSDNFVVGLQEVFIPKGGVQPGRQPERRNILIAYDWSTGQEKKNAFPLGIGQMVLPWGPLHQSCFITAAIPGIFLS